jgi:transcriptional antiterminator Rof (Rho-off)
MLNKTDILAKLQEGVSLEDIAASLSTALNEAHDEYLAIQKEEEAKTEKMNELASIIEALFGWVRTYHPDVADLLDEEVDYLTYAADIDKSIPMIADMARSAEKLSNKLNDIWSFKVGEAPVNESIDPFQEFFNKYGLMS